MGTVFGGSTTNTLDGAVVTVSGPVTRSQTNDATGFYGFVDLPAGVYAVTAAFPGYTNGTTNVTINLGIVGTRDLVLIRQGQPTIAAHPQSQSVKVGTNAAFSVVASGAAPLRYQWHYNGAVVPGATNSSIMLIPVAWSNAGSYSVTVTNGVGSVTSTPATLTVLPPDPSHIDSITMLPDGRVQLEIRGDAGHYVVEYSSNLVFWADLTNILNTNGSFWCLDAETNVPLRFYRARR